MTKTDEEIVAEFMDIIYTLGADEAGAGGILYWHGSEGSSTDGGKWVEEHPPNYSSDLNLIREVELKLAEKGLWEKYEYALLNIWGGEYYGIYGAVISTSWLQRFITADAPTKFKAIVEVLKGEKG